MKRRQRISAAVVAVVDAVAVVVTIIFDEVSAPRHTVLHTTVGAIPTPGTDQTKGGKGGCCCGLWVG